MTTSLLEKLGSYHPFSVMVVGDFMLDQYVYGAAERLSPDAPVPVLHAQRSEDHAGGAANVALCLGGLKGQVLCFGVVGADVEGQILCKALASAGCDVSGIVQDDARPTTVKRSLIGLAQHRHPQKMFRLDYESRAPISDTTVEKLLAMIEARLDEAEIICLEDYNKGVCCESFCQRLIAMCKTRGKRILVDPAAIEDYRKYRGASAITPNRSEAELATGLDTPLDASEIHSAGLATKLVTELDLEAIVVTLDRHGAMLEERSGAPVLVPTLARQVYDVTGAGDMVLAALSGGLVNGLTWTEAVQFANAAAGLEVEVFGVQPIPFAQVYRAILRQSREWGGKVRTIAELEVELAAHREVGHRIVFTNGCFDVLHAGHVAYLREARRLGDVLVVAINADEQVRAQKGPGRPVHQSTDRAEVLSELQCVDFVTVFDEPTPHAVLERIRPDVLVKGGDYALDQVIGREIVQGYGGEVRVLVHKPGLSSTKAIAGNVETSKRQNVETSER